MIELINGDCMEALKGFNDDQFDLAIVDPPYGIGIDKKQNYFYSAYSLTLSNCLFNDSVKNAGI